MNKKLQIIGVLCVFLALLCVGLIVQSNKETPIEDAVDSKSYQVTSFPINDIKEVEYTINGETDTYFKESYGWSLKNSSLSIKSDPVSVSCALMSNFSSNEKFDSVENAYGTDNSTSYAKVYLNDDSVITFTIGDKTPDGQYDYIKVDGSDNDGIYLMSVLATESLLLSKDDVAKKEFEEIDFPTMNKIVINQRDYQNLVLEIPEEDVQIAENYQGVSKLIMQSPYPNKTIFMQNFVDEVFPTITTLQFAHLIESDCEDISKYGLDNPYLTINIVSDSGQINLLIGDEFDESHYYAKNVNENNVFTISKELIEPFINIDCFKFLNTFVALYPIDTVDFVTLCQGDMAYSIKQDEVNGVAVDSEAFSGFYKTLASLEIDRPIYNVAESSDNSNNVIMEYVLKDGTIATYEFIPYSDNAYAYFDTQSGMWFAVSMAQIDHIFNSCYSLINP